MHFISVPFMYNNPHREEIVNELRRAGASRVFLCFPASLTDSERNKPGYALLQKNIAYYEAAGFEVGVWMLSIGHGGAAATEEEAKRAPFTLLRGIKGRYSADAYCPMDARFEKALCEVTVNVARAGARMIMFDDDFRLSSRVDCGCTCDAHVAEYCRRTGEEIKADDILRKAFTGGKNKYRDAWLSLMGDTLRNLARALRRAVDEVDDTVRLGACSCLSVWDSDGVDSVELAKIFAGKNKPFMRLIGAPYWVTGHWSRPYNRIGYVIECERMEAFWCENSGVEIYGEGDVGRPIYNTPSVYLECLDTALLADGRFTGTQKYLLPYTGAPSSELGYVERSVKNIQLCREIEKHFSGKNCVGLRVAACKNKLAEKEFTDADREISTNYDDGFGQPEQMLLCDNSLPMTYGDGDVTVLFGENARQVKEIPLAAVLDMPAAVLLQKRGVDVGLIGCKKSDIPAETEYFKEYNASWNVRAAVYEAKLSENARVSSLFRGGGKEFPAVYRYENKSGNRFAVLCFDANAARRYDALSRSYLRQRQLIDAVAFLSEKPLPAVCPGHPDLYILCKKGADSMAVGLWDFSPDSVLDPVITLDRAYSRIEFINCAGRMEENRVILSAEIPAFGFAGFEVFY